MKKAGYNRGSPLEFDFGKLSKEKLYFACGKDSSEYTPSRLLNYLCRSEFLRMQYNFRPWPFSSVIKRHHVRVLTFLEKKCWDLDQIVPLHIFRLFIALHDVGKRWASSNGAPEDQLLYTRKIVDSFCVQLEIESEYRKLFWALLQKDIVGKYLKKRLRLKLSEFCFYWIPSCRRVFSKRVSSLESFTLLELKEACSLTCLTRKSFLDLMVLYHKVDSGSYFLLGFLFRSRGIEYRSMVQEFLNRLYSQL